MNTTNINKIKITPIVTKSGYNRKNVRAFDYFQEPYSIITLYAKKKSGKSNVIYRCLEECATKGTNVMIFASSCHTDDVYKQMKKMLKKKGCNVQIKPHFIENGVNLIQQFLHLKENINDDSEDEIELVQKTYIPKTIPYLEFPGSTPLSVLQKRKKKPEKKDKLLTPENIFIFDDLSSEMRNPWISRLLTRNRHVLSKVFISCHGVHNIHPDGLRMVDVHLLFPHLDREKVEAIVDMCGLSFSCDTKKDKFLWELYKDATSKPYNFLYCDYGNMQFRKNFNEVYNVDR